MCSASARPVLEDRLPFYYGWLNLTLAVLVSVVALPSMTWGLGLITEPLRADLVVSETTWAEFNFWAKVASGLCLLPAGLLIDRYGSRWIAVGCCLLLGISIWLMGQVTTHAQLLAVMVVSRSLGQGVLAVASVAMVGKWFFRRVSLAMTLYGIVAILAYVAAERLVGASVQEYGWRTTWNGCGLVIACGAAPLILLLARSRPHAQSVKAAAERPGALSSAGGLPASPEGVPVAADLTEERSFTLLQAAATPVFWVFALAGAANGGSQAAVSLFGVTIFEANGIEDGLAVFLRAIATVSSIAAIAALLLTGTLSRWWSQAGLLRLACLFGIMSSLLLPRATTDRLADLFGGMWGMQSGILMVVTNTVWAKYYGRRHQGAIEGFTMFVQFAAQAGAPWVLARMAEQLGSAGVFFDLLAIVFLLLLLGGWLASAPRKLPEAAKAASDDDRSGDALSDSEMSPAGVPAPAAVNLNSVESAGN